MYSLYKSLSVVCGVCSAIIKKIRELGELCLGELSSAPTELTLGTTTMFVFYKGHERHVSRILLLSSE